MTVNEKYFAEPFKIKAVEPIRMTTREEREQKIKEANYNLFGLNSVDVYIDLLTDSGTGAMSQNQWAGIMLGDEAYAGAQGATNLRESAKEIFGYKFIQPVHQGRAAEKVTLPIFLEKGKYCISNMHFDTTRAHVELAGGEAVDCVIREALDTELFHPFKGNMDVERMEKILNEKGADKCGLVIITVTNNSAGGQPVSMANIKATAELAKKHNIPVLIDAARYAENCYFIKEREEGYKDKDMKAIAKEMFSYASIFNMSSKKDGLVNMGGLIGVKDDEELWETVKARTIPYEGFLSYGGLAGRDLEALAIGLQEAIDYHFQQYRVGQMEYLGGKLKAAGVPFQYPAGGHAIFLDAKKILPHIPYYEFPAHALAVELYKEAGIRSCDIGSYMMGNDPVTGKQIESEFEFTRFAVPRRVYTQSHMDVLAEATIAVMKKASTVGGYKITWEPKVLRHFTSKLEPLKK